MTIPQRARWAVLTILAAVLYGLGWTVGAATVAWAWTSNAVMTGWDDARKQDGDHHGPA